MADNKYFDSKDHRLEFNIPEWVDFLYDKSYNWPEPSGVSEDYQYQGKTIKGGPYWSFKLKAGGQEYTWNVKKKEVAEALNSILAAGKRQVAVMKMSGTGDDKKHYLCLSNPSGSLMTCIPNRDIPKHFVDFVASYNGEGVAPQPPHEQQPPAVPPSGRKTMADCLMEAFEAWRLVVLEADRRRLEANDNISEMIFANVNKAMGEGLAQTAHTIFIVSNKQ